LETLLSDSPRGLIDNIRLVAMAVNKQWNLSDEMYNWLPYELECISRNINPHTGAPLAGYSLRERLRAMALLRDLHGQNLSTKPQEHHHYLGEMSAEERKAEFDKVAEEIKAECIAAGIPVSLDEIGYSPPLNPSGNGHETENNGEA
jgi:hypothetical protein